MNVLRERDAHAAPEGALEGEEEAWDDGTRRHCRRAAGGEAVGRAGGRQVKAEIDVVRDAVSKFERSVLGIVKVAARTPAVGEFCTMFFFVPADGPWTEDLRACGNARCGLAWNLGVGAGVGRRRFFSLSRRAAAGTEQVDGQVLWHLCGTLRRSFLH